MVGVKQRLDVPAGHQTILGGDSNDSGSLVGVLAVGYHPSDWFSVISPDILDGHDSFAVEIPAV